MSFMWMWQSWRCGNHCSALPISIYKFPLKKLLFRSFSLYSVVFVSQSFTEVTEKFAYWENVRAEYNWNYVKNTTWVFPGVIPPIIILSVHEIIHRSALIHCNKTPFPALIHFLLIAPPSVGAHPLASHPPVYIPRRNDCGTIRRLY